MAIAGAALAAFDPWMGVPLLILGACTAGVFYQHARRADALIERMRRDPEVGLASWTDAVRGDEVVLGTMGIYARGDFTDLTRGYRIDELQLIRTEDGIHLELTLGSRTGRPMPVRVSLPVPEEKRASTIDAARRLADYFEAPLAIEPGVEGSGEGIRHRS